MTLPRPPMTLDQAARHSPTFARLAEQVADSTKRLRAIENLIPQALRPAIKAGPVDDSAWCLIVDNSAVAAKVRQLLPLFQTRLGSLGWQVTSIRLKVQTGRR